MFTGIIEEVGKVKQIFSNSIVISAKKVLSDVKLGDSIAVNGVCLTVVKYSEAEFEVMKIVWKYAPISTNEITEKLTQISSWSPKTIQTLIKRLVSKKALTYEKQSRVFVYTPLVKEDEYIRQESNSFLKQYYNGNITSMLASYIEDDKLSEEDIASLRNLLSNH